MRRNVWWLVGVGLVVSLVLAFGVSRYASSDPDGLERVAEDHGFDAGVRDHAFADGPFADYEATGIDDAGLSTGVAGVVGVVVTFGVTMGVVGLIRFARRSSSSSADLDPSDDGVASALP